MPRFRKDVLKVDRYSIPAPGGGRRVVEYTPADLKEMHDNFKAQMAVSEVYAPPFCAEHQDNAKPRPLAERLASKVFGHLGYTEDVELSEDGTEIFFVLGDLDEESAKVAERIKWVSPEIETDFKDGTGRVWPGKTITHVAATPRPVQINQKPFQRLSHNIVRLSLADRLGDTTVADELNIEPASDIKKVLEALTVLGVSLPDDTTMENLTDRLIGAAAVKGGIQDDVPPEEELPTDEPIVPADSPVMMSLTKRLEATDKRLEFVEARYVRLQRDDLGRRIGTLRNTGRINKPLCDKLMAELKTVRLSLNEAGELASVPLLNKVEAYEALDEGASTPVHMSHAGVTEVPDPEEEAQRPDDHVMHQLTGGRWTPPSKNGK